METDPAEEVLDRTVAAQDAELTEDEEEENENGGEVGEAFQVEENSDLETADAELDVDVDDEDQNCDRNAEKDENTDYNDDVMEAEEGSDQSALEEEEIEAALTGQAPASFR